MRFASIGILKLRQDVRNNPCICGDETTFHLVFIPHDIRRAYNEFGTYSPVGNSQYHEWRTAQIGEKDILSGEENCCLPYLLRFSLEELARTEEVTIRYHAWRDYLDTVPNGTPVVNISIHATSIKNPAKYAKNLVRKLDRWAWRQEAYIEAC